LNQPIPATLGAFSVLESLAAGPAGQVFDARRSGRRALVAVVPPEAADEARRWVEPIDGVVPVEAAGHLAGGAFWLAVEAPATPDADASADVVRLARALEGVHGAGLIHGAVGPSAIRDRGAALLPGPTARVLAPRDARFEPPERRQSPPGVAGDLWGLGCVARELWPGMGADPDAGTVARILAPFEAPDETLPEPVRALLEPAPERRPPSARVARAALETVAWPAATTPGGAGAPLDPRAAGAVGPCAGCGRIGPRPPCVAGPPRLTALCGACARALPRDAAFCPACGESAGSAAAAAPHVGVVRLVGPPARVRDAALLLEGLRLPMEVDVDAAGLATWVPAVSDHQARRAAIHLALALRRALADGCGAYAPAPDGIRLGVGVGAGRFGVGPGRGPDGEAFAAADAAVAGAAAGTIHFEGAVPEIDRRALHIPPEALTDRFGVVVQAGGAIEVHGRNREMTQLVGAAEAVLLDAQLERVTLLGAPASGKSTLLSHLAARLHGTADGWRCIPIAAGPEDAEAPLWPFRRGLAAWFGLPPSGGAAALARLLARRFPGWPPTLIARLGGWLAAPRARAGRRPDAAVAASSARVLLGEIFERLTRRGPLALLVDGLHRADPSSRALIDHLADRLADRRLLIVAASREGGPLLEGGDCLALSRLDDDAGWGIVSTLTGVGPEGWVSDVFSGPAAWLAAAGGEPFHIATAARLWGQRADAGEPDAARLPARLSDLIRGRIAALPNRARAVLARAAGVGRDVPLHVLEATLTVDDAPLDDLRGARPDFEQTLGRLLDGGFLSMPTPGADLRPGQPLVAFAHQAYWAHARAQVPPGVARWTQDRAACALTTETWRGGAPAVRRLADLLTGLDRSEAAVDAWLQASAEALGDGGGQEALAAARRAAVLAEDVGGGRDPVACWLALSRAAVAFDARSADPGDSTRALEHPRLTAPADRFEAFALRARIAAARGEHDAAVRWVGSALESGGGAPQARAELHLLTANCAGLATPEAAARALEQARAALAEGPDAGLATAVALESARWARRAGDWQEADAMVAAALAHADASGAVPSRLAALRAAARSARRTGDEVAGRARAVALGELALASGAVQMRIEALLHLSGWARARREIAEARLHLDSASNLARRVGRAPAALEVAAGQLALHDGQPSAARASAQRALAAAEATDDLAARVDAIRLQALAWAADGRLDEAVPRLERALGLAASPDLGELRAIVARTAAVIGGPDRDAAALEGMVGASAECIEAMWIAPVDAGASRGEPITQP
jgi:hypothetical protein